jgi:hypothetical protein
MANYLCSLRTISLSPYFRSSREVNDVNEFGYDAKVEKRRVTPISYQPARPRANDAMGMCCALVLVLRGAIANAAYEGSYVATGV